MFNEKFQCQDSTDHNALLTQQYLELLTQAHNETSGFVAPDLPACLGSLNANSAGRLPTNRRHSSMFAPTPAKTTTLAPFSETNGFLNNGFGGVLETVTEERIRNRAYSEGSYLNSDALLEQQQQQQQQAQSGASRYKTELCRPFEENGKCKYGEKCQFAHGKHELRHMVRHPKYKTELCRTYHTTGLCPYGPRCHFIHNQDEPLVPMITNPVQRHHRGSPPNNLQLFPQQRAVTRLNSHSCSPLETPSPFFGINDNSVIAPISPIGHGIGKAFQYGNHIVSPTEVPRLNNKFRCLSENRQPSPPLTPFDFAQGQFSDLSVSDDVVFDGPPTPPDSDRESATGSPPGFAAPAPGSQRLPIFKCLSQSD